MKKFGAILSILFTILIYSVNANSIELNDDDVSLDKEVYTIGIFACRSKELLSEKWSVLPERLNNVFFDKKFKVKILHANEVESSVANQEIDFLLTTPSNYIEMREKYNPFNGVLATKISSAPAPASASFSSSMGGVMFKRKDNKDIKSLSDLHKIEIISANEKFLGGYIAQIEELKTLGISESDLNIRFSNSTQGIVIKMVMRGEFDVGFVRTGMLEKLNKEGIIDLSKIEVLNKKEYSDFPFLISTKKYPEWPFLSLKHVDNKTSAALSHSLTTMNNYDNTAIKLGIHGFSIPYDYSPVEKAMISIGSSPFNDRYSYKITWDEYNYIIIPLIIFFVMTLALLIVFLTKNKLILKNQKRLILVSTVFKSVHESVIITDKNLEILEANPSFFEKYGYKKSEIIGKTPRVLKSDEHDPMFYKKMWESINEKGEWSGEVINKDSRGVNISQLLSITAIKDQNDEVVNYVSVLLDISEIKEHQDRLIKMANYDELTNLPNRRLLNDRLHQAIKHAKRDKKSIAIVYLDLDGFKKINDNYGHNKGDNFLIKISKNLLKSIRETDTIARIGGDEFVIIINSFKDDDELKVILNRILTNASKKIEIDNVMLSVSASMGVVKYPDSNDDADTLIRTADHSMYVAKKSGKNRYFIFNANEEREIEKRKKELSKIKKAIRNNEFQLYYQPKICLKDTNKIVGAEGLIRWVKGDGTISYPDDFLPIVNGTELEKEIGFFVLKSALLEIKYLCDNQIDIPISINVSPFEISNEYLLDNLNAIEPELRKFCKNLEIEILESTEINNIEHLLIIIDKIKALGISVSLDDFGTGYSSLSNLKRIPVDKIKIDKSFVIDMLINEDDFSMVKGIIKMANTFNKDTVAEGVESFDHAVILRELGCKYAQGYGISKALPKKEFLLWVKEWEGEIEK